MLSINPYLNFDGKTEEAFNFYKSVFGGEFTTFQRMKDVPGLPGTEQMTENELERMMHIALPIGQHVVLMGTDTIESLGHRLNPGNNYHLSIQAISRILFIC